MEYELVTVPIVACDKGEAKTTQQTVQVLKGTSAATLAQFKAVAKLATEQCEKEAIAAVPEWWQVRIEAARPQLVLLFGKLLPDGRVERAKYALTLPHYSGSRTNIPPIGRYQKGQSEGILTLNDNSKVVVNAVSESEANRVLFQAKQALDPKYLEGSFIKIGPRRGQTIAAITVVPLYGKFFPTGLRDTKPAWTAYYR
jgi:hypothetical protein